MSADLVLINGKIFTMNPTQPHAEAVAIEAAKIIQVGTNSAVTNRIGKQTKVIDLKGKTVIPGFIDSHIHVADFGRVLTWLDLWDVTSIKELQARLTKFVQKTPKGDWIIGRGWEQNSFAENRLPTCYDLDSVSPDNPVILYQRYGQMAIANSKALEIAGLTKQTVFNSKAVNTIEEMSQLPGVLRGDATNSVWKFIPTMTQEELMEAVVSAFKKIVRAGITSVCWIVFSLDELLILKKINEQNRVPLSIYVIIPVELLDSELTNNIIKDTANSSVKVSGAVIFADGYLSAKTAAMFEPYRDCSDSNGRLLYTQEEMNLLAVKIHKANLQLNIHAAGDKAVDMALTAIENISKETEGRELRSRIEQAAVLNQGLIERIKNSSVIVSVQPCVMDSEFRVWSASERLGPERSIWLYPLKTLVNSGIKVIGGSDCPMEPLNPMLGIQAAVTREFVSDERVTVEDALRIYTSNAAYAFSEENIKGSIEKGKNADLTVLSHDLLGAEHNEVEKIDVEMNIARGRVIYSKL
jgi:predicted amidohydrolase YtcJ